MATRPLPNRYYRITEAIPITLGSGSIAAGIQVKYLSPAGGRLPHSPTLIVHYFVGDSITSATVYSSDFRRVARLLSSEEVDWETPDF
jgi:hypothetical protein